MKKVKTIYGQELPVIGFRYINKEGVQMEKPSTKGELLGVRVRNPDGSPGLVTRDKVANFDELPKRVKP